MSSHTPSLRRTDSVSYRLSVASRVLAAVIGGYALAAAIELLLVLTLPFPQEPPFPQAAQAARLLIHAIHAAILLWVFHTRSATRAWAWLTGWTLVVYAACWMLIRQGGAA
ncbi:iron transporter [Thauera sinica]|uniref:Iron transporter n=1 Tax=Thauera sinica TaxID=2665146 RepID=A0ABW1AQU8_9RHOO|nr:iron transporter [Thauera sp. K11]ATE62519.1 iron transporter [Thauera sp. K11]